jgi:hypothetical protein
MDEQVKEQETPETPADGKIVIRATSIPIQLAPSVVEVRDTDGHLLFCVNAKTRSIEIQSRGRRFSVEIDLLRVMAMRLWMPESEKSVVARPLDEKGQSGLD